MTAKTKPKKALNSQLSTITLEKLHNHPANPVPPDTDVAEQVEWMRSGKQHEPLIVRQHCDIIGAFEVLSGRRRFAAATELGWPTLQCIVRDFASEEEAVAFMFEVNADRHADTPIRQALGIHAMVIAGMSFAAAGKVYGLKTSEAARSKLRLLELPAVWQQRVISGEMSESAARLLCPYAMHPTLMEHFESDFKNTMDSRWLDDRVAWTDRDSLKNTLRYLIEEKTRPVEAGDEYHADGFTKQQRYFELDDITEASLDIVRAPLGANGAVVRRALNVAKYDELNAPFIDAKRNGSRAKKKGATAGSSSSAKKLTPAEQSALDRQRKTAAAKKTADAVHVWKYRFLRMLLAAEIKSGSYITTLLLPWVMGHVQSRRNEFCTDPAPLSEYLRAAATIVAGENNRCPNYKPDEHCASLINLIANDSLDDEISCSEDLQATLLSFLLWPQCEARPRSLERLLSVDPPQAWRPMSAKDRASQVFLLVIDDRDIDTLVKLTGVSIAEGWRRGAIGGSRERRMIEEFFALHTRPALNDLAIELLGTTSAEATQVADQKRSSDAVALLHDAHTSKRPLPLPKSLGSRTPTKKK